MKTALLLLISAALGFAQTQKSSIAGSVTNMAGEPVKGATLRLMGLQTTGTTGVGTAGPTQAASQSRSYSTAADAYGKFTFEDLEPGKYSICSDKAGYFPACYENSKSERFDLSAGQRLTGVDIKMRPHGVISGRITDEFGDPYPNARVRAARWGYQNGQKRLLPSPVDSANVDGVFAIGNLEAGSYYILAEPRPADQIVNAATIQKGPPESYVTTYYPGVIDPSGAIAMQVPMGGSIRNMEIRLRRAPVYHIRGKIADLGAGAPSPTVTLAPKDGPNLTSRSSVAREGFDFGGVLPGVYVLQAVSSYGPVSGVARQTVTVGNADVDNLIVQMRPGAEIAGTISIDGNLSRQQSGGGNGRPTVQLSGVEGASAASQQPPNNDGTFAIHNIVPQVYRVNVLGLPPGTYVKSIRLNNQDVTQTVLDLTSGSGGTLDVVLSPHAGDISGIVHGADGTALPNVLVTVWAPGAPPAGATTLNTDANGQFKFGNLGPGDYRIAAWEKVDPGLPTAPEFRVRFEDKAARVHLDEDGHESTEAPLIGRDAIETEAAKL
jgi:protocatechuate 3,4-dioxygenase beta subunit